MSEKQRKLDLRAHRPQAERETESQEEHLWEEFCRALKEACIGSGYVHEEPEQPKNFQKKEWFGGT